MPRPKATFPEPKLTKQASGIYQITWTEDGKTRRQSTDTTDYREAHIALTRKKMELLTPKLPSPRPTIKEVCGYYLDDKKRDGKSERSLMNLRNSLRPIIEHLGDLHFDTLTDDVMKEYARWRKKQTPRGPEHIIAARRDKDKGTIANATIRREVTVLRAALKLCARQKLIPSVPSPMCPVSVTDKRPRYLSKPDYARLLDASKDTPHINLYLQLALLTGQRRETILSLKWSDVQIDFSALTADLLENFTASPDDGLPLEELDPEAPIPYAGPMPLKLSRSVIITFGEGRGNKRKAPPLAIHDEELIRSLYRAYQVRQSDYVIEWHGKPVKDVKTGINRTCDRAGLPRMGTHVMRHTTISWLISAGVSSAVVSKRVCVTQAIIEKHYAHLSPEIQQLAEQHLSIKGLATLEKSS